MTGAPKTADVVIVGGGLAAGRAYAVIASWWAKM